MAVSIPKDWLPWVWRGLVLVLVVFLAKAWNDAHSAEAALSKELEREKIEKANLLAERDANKKELSRLEKELLDYNPDLKGENERLKKLLDEKPKVVEVVKWKTKVVEVPSDPHDAPRDCPQPGPDGKPSKEIVLLAGDTGHAEVNEITYETKKGNNVIIGKAFCYRDTPTPRLLFSSVIESPVSIALQTPDPEPYRWGAGLYVGVSKDMQLALGPSLAFPPFHFLWLQWEPTVSVGFTATGTVQPAAQLVGRWR